MGSRLRPCGGMLSRRSPRFHRPPPDRKSTRLNSSHLVISYAVFCLKKNHRRSRPSAPEGTITKDLQLSKVANALHSAADTSSSHACSSDSPPRTPRSCQCFRRDQG